MKEQLITFETAKLAKEKGFNIEINQYWCNKILSDNFQQNVDWNNIAESHISAPTKSLLQKWLRENHNIHIGIWCNTLTGNYRIDYIINIKTGNEYYLYESYEIELSTYEESLELSLQIALKHIEL